MPPSKVTDYLLNPSSKDGASKCAYLESYGYSPARPVELLLDLYEHATVANFIGVIVAPYGVKFRFDGLILAPNGRDARMLTVWQVKAGSDGTALLVTSRPSNR